MSNLQNFVSARHDEFSVQVTSIDSPRFFVRLDLTKSSADTLVFSDFTFQRVDRDKALAALRVVQTEVGKLRNILAIVILDILPTGTNEMSENLDKKELCRRHDLLVDTFRMFGDKNNFVIVDQKLNFRFGKFDTLLTVQGIDE